MNTEDSETNKFNKSFDEFTDKRNLINSNTNIASANLSIYYTWKNIKSAYNKNKFKISSPNWNDEFDFPDGSYSISYIQDYFEYIIKKHGTITDNSPVQIYINKIKTRIVFNRKAGYKLELLGRVIKAIYENVPKLESVEVVSVHCNLVNKEYQQASKVLFTFVPNKQFGQLITISPYSLTMLKTTNAKSQSIEVWLTDQNNKPLEIEENVKITLIIRTG